MRNCVIQSFPRNGSWGLCLAKGVIYKFKNMSPRGMSAIHPTEQQRTKSSTMSVQKQLQVYWEAARAVFAGLPPNVQRALVNPYVKKGVSLLVALKLAKGLSGYLSRRAQNSWLRIDQWDPSRELVVLTGGCSGIGKQIMQDLSKKNVKVIILDINEPDFSLRMSHALTGSGSFC